MIDKQQRYTQENHDNRSRIASGAGVVFLGRLGAVVEAVAIFTFTWLYGASTFGLFAVLWSLLVIATPIADFAMTLSLQRFVPKGSEDEAHEAIGFALKWSFSLATIIATSACIAAPFIAEKINANIADAEHLTNVIRLYVWILPFWILVEVGTAAIRARRTFGPEIRVRIFYEQGMRLVAGVSFYMLGWMTYGLFLAHMLAVFLAAMLAMRLIAKQLDFKRILKAPIRGKLPSAMLHYAKPMAPAYLIKSLFSEMPVIFLNQFLPGAAGAAASGYYKIARQVTSVLQMVGQTFEYVMAPLASEKDGQNDIAGLREMYSFVVRISTVVALPFTVALILARFDILSLLKPEFSAAAAAIIALSVARMFEVLAGPSTSLVEMLGHRLLPITNNLIGLLIMTSFSAYLIPLYGITGGAIAAGLAINTTAILAFIESIILFKMRPYDSRLIKPLIIVLFFSITLLFLDRYVNDYPPPTGVIVSLLGFFLTLFMTVRYGLSKSDAEALGAFGRFAKSKNIKPTVETGTSHE